MFWRITLQGGTEVRVQANTAAEALSLLQIRLQEEKEKAFEVAARAELCAARPVVSVVQLV